MNLDIEQFLNFYDIFFLIVISISVFFGIKNGFIKSIFNLIKWILIFYVIKNCFNFLRPIVDVYVSNQTVSDILIFLATLITSYIFFSFLNRIIIGIMQPKRSGLIDIGFGAALGTFRGYIFFVLLIFFLNNNLFQWSVPDFLNDGTFKTLVDYGINFIEYIPRNLDDLGRIDV